MACRNSYKKKTRRIMTQFFEGNGAVATVGEQAVSDLIFGVDSASPANVMLQNNLSMLEWVTRNKVYPVFWGRNLNGDGRLTAQEITYLYLAGCKIAAIYVPDGERNTEEMGAQDAAAALKLAEDLCIPRDAAIFTETNDTETTAYLKGYAQGVLAQGYVPGFRAKTDAQFGFDREYSRGMQTDREIFSRCLIWALSPTIAEYDRITTTHLIHPDEWKPFAPSGIRRKDIAAWQYGKDCHAIGDENDREVCFNINLIRNEAVITNHMF